MTGLRRPLLPLTVACLAARLLTAPSYPQDQDAVYFTRGVARYSVAELRPHWPGYPVYIWLGKALAAFTGEPAGALRLLSIAASVLCLWPIALAARRWRLALGGDEPEARRAGLAAALLWCVAPLPWVVGTEIYSDSAGLLAALALLLLCWRSLEEPGAGTWLLAAALVGGLLLGIRLAYLPLLGPLAYAAWRARGRRVGAVPLPLAALLAFGFPVAAWLGWQWAQDGPHLLRAAHGHLIQHLRTPDNTAASDSQVATRPLRLVETLVVYGLGGWWRGTSLLRLPATLALLALLAGASSRLARARGGAALLPWLWVAPYVVGVLLGHDVRIPRYSLPLVSLASVLAGLGLPPRPRAARLATAALALSVGAVSVPLALAHSASPPAGVQLVRYLAARTDPAKTVLLLSPGDGPLGLFADSEAPRIVHAPGGADRAARLADEFEASGSRVFATEPAAWAPEQWAPVARFCRDGLIDGLEPRELWLFLHDTGHQLSRDAPGCQ